MVAHCFRKWNMNLIYASSAFCKWLCIVLGIDLWNNITHQNSTGWWLKVEHLKFSLGLVVCVRTEFSELYNLSYSSFCFFFVCMYPSLATDATLSHSGDSPRPKVTEANRWYIPWLFIKPSFYHLILSLILFLLLFFFGIKTSLLRGPQGEAWRAACGQRTSCLRLLA